MKRLEFLRRASLTVAGFALGRDLLAPLVPAAEVAPAAAAPATTWALFPEGTFIVKGAGLCHPLIPNYEWGVIPRDTKNDYQVFHETFENVAAIGHEPIRIESTIVD